MIKNFSDGFNEIIENRCFNYGNEKNKCENYGTETQYQNILALKYYLRAYQLLCACADSDSGCAS